VLVVAAAANIGLAATTSGSSGDGKTSISYDVSTGEIVIQPDGQPVGLFDIQSASGIFIADARLPPGGLGLDVNTANRKSWAALQPSAFLADFSLGAIAPPGLTNNFLLNDLTLTGSGGFGTENRALDLLPFEIVDGFIVVVDANLGNRAQGAQIEHQFSISAGIPPIFWSNLTPIAGNPLPKIAPSLTASGQFSWNTAGSPLGTYRWDVTATNPASSDTGQLTVTLIPEPATVSLFGAAIVAFQSFCHRRVIGRLRKQ
jgi:hypothetical protein